jgi:type 1 fimbria pilin
MSRFMLLAAVLAAPCLTSGCIAIAATDLAVGAAVGTVRVAGDVAEGTVNLVTPGDKDEDEEEERERERERRRN